MKLRLLFVTVALFVAMATRGAGQDFDWEKAISLYKQGQFRAAIVEFQKVITAFPAHADSWKFIGLAYYQLQDYTQALPALEKASMLKQAEGKTDTDMLLALSRTNISLKKYDKALPTLENLTKQQPNATTNYYMLGVAYANLNRIEEAIAAFKSAVQLAPKDADAWQYLGMQQFRAGHLREAIESFRNGLAAAPKNVEIMVLLVEALLRQGESETIEAKASPHYEEAIRIAIALRTLRDDASTSELLGRGYLAAKKYSLAESALQRAITLSQSGSAALYFNLGFAQAQNKAWTRAAESFMQADRLNPNDVNTLYYLGYVYENLRRYQQALDVYTKAFEASGRTNQDLKASIDRVAPYAKSQ